MSRRLTAALVAAAVLAPAAGPAAAAPYNWDALGAEFCRLTLAGDFQALRPLLSDPLARAVIAASANPALPPPNVLFQTYTNPVPVCAARTLNAALVEIHRSMPGGAAPSWTEYLEVVPVADGTTRIDDVLFATRRSDTLRSRLTAYGAPPG